MACGLSFTLLATDGTAWQITMNAGGQLVATQVSDGQPVTLKSYYGEPAASRIDIVNGMLTTSVASFSDALSDRKTASDPSGNSWSLIVDRNGLLYTLLTGAATPDPVIGQLIKLGLDSYPAAVQPGGPGTAVTSPAQSHGGGNIWDLLPDESMGKYFSGCGHNLSTPCVVRQAVSCKSKALIICSLCGYLNRVMELDDFYNNVNNPVTTI